MLVNNIFIANTGTENSRQNCAIYQIEQVTSLFYEWIHNDLKSDNVRKSEFLCTFY